MCVQGFKRRETNRQTDERTGAEGPSSDREQRRKVDKSERNRRGEAVGKYREREKKKKKRKGKVKRGIGSKGQRKRGPQCFEVARFAAGLSLKRPIRAFCVLQSLVVVIFIVIVIFIVVVVVASDVSATHWLKNNQSHRPNKNVYEGALMRSKCITACATFQHSHTTKWNTR